MVFVDNKSPLEIKVNYNRVFKAVAKMTNGLEH